MDGTQIAYLRVEGFFVEGITMKMMTRVTAMTACLLIGVAAQADIVVLDADTQCSADTAENGISITDVTGNNGGATDCWGTYDGNDPGPGGSFQIDGNLYDYVQKYDGVFEPEANAIGLSVDDGLGGDPFAGRSGNWSFAEGSFESEPFLIVLKAASRPGFAVWLFSGDDADSYSGTWSVAWPQALSHFSVYACSTISEGCGGTTVPAPGTLALLGLGLLGMGAARRRKVV